MNRGIESLSKNPLPNEIPESEFESKSPQNSFLVFLEENREQVDFLNSSWEEFTTENQGWKKSPTFELLIDNFADEAFGHHKIETKEKHKVWLRNSLRTLMFARTPLLDPASVKDTFDRLIAVGDQALDSSTPQAQEAAGAIGEFADHHRDAVIPLFNIYSKNQNLFLNSVKTHLSSGSMNLEQFADFLTSQEYKHEREKNKTLLRVLSENVLDPTDRNIIKSSLRQTAEKEQVSPSPFILENFIRERLRKKPSQLSWITFAARLKGINLNLNSDSGIQETAIMLSQNTPLPTDLSADLSSYIRKFHEELDHSIKRGLLPFTPPLDKIPQPPAFAANRAAIRQTKRDRSAEIKGQKVIFQTLYILDQDEEQEEKEPFSISLVKSGQYGSSFIDLSEQEVDDFTKKTSGELARGDQRMKRDIAAILADLSIYPSGAGTKKLTSQKIGIGSTSFDIRRLAPDNRPTLKYEHEQTRDLRIVYVIDRKNRRVAIIGIFPHSEFDKRF